MKITKQIILDNADDSRTWEESETKHGAHYTLQYTIGQFTLSISLGLSAYCHPRVGLQNPGDYKQVEGAILDDSKEGPGLMGVAEITSLFGRQVGRLCEGYGWDKKDEVDRDEDGIGAMLSKSSTVMPFVTWDDIVMVADAIHNHYREINGITHARKKQGLTSYNIFMEGFRHSIKNGLEFSEAFEFAIEQTTSIYGEAIALSCVIQYWRKHDLIKSLNYKFYSDDLMSK